MRNVKIPIHRRNLNVRIKDIPNWRIAEQDKKDLPKFLEDLELGKVNKGKKISESRRLKYLDLLKIPLTFFFAHGQGKYDTEKFEKFLVKKKYADSTKAGIRLMLRTYLKWKLGETEEFHKLTDWFDTREPKRTPDYLKEEEIIKLYNACKTNAERFLIAVLFDSGCRAEEFHNIRMEDIQLPKEHENFVKITFKQEYSKTNGRVINLYWKHSLESVRSYYDERKKEGAKSDEPIFKNSYDNTRQFLYRIGKKVLKRNVHYHLFRHGSATYYAQKLKPYQMCYRYGWKFSSDMPEVYISRAGMVEEDVEEKFTATELEELKKQLEKQEQDNKIMRDYTNQIVKNTKENTEITTKNIDMQIKINELILNKIKKEENKKRIKKFNLELIKRNKKLKQTLQTLK